MSLRLRAGDFVRSIRGASAVVRYTTGFGIAAAALVLTALAAPAMGRPPSIPLFAASLLIAWVVGFGPAILTAASGVVVLDLLDRLDDASIGAWRPGAQVTSWTMLFIAMALAMAWLASAIRRLEDDRQQLLQRERAARVEAEAASRAKNDFLAIVSHELRTPLMAIVGWLHVLRRGELDRPERERVFATIERNAMLQATLIDDLLDASRAITGKLQITMRRAEVGPLVTHAVESMRPKAAAAGVALDASIGADVAVCGDESRLQQVVTNLLSNATKFTPPGGSIHVAVRRHVGSAVISVTDSGAGIDPEDLPHVFDRFYQGAFAERRGLGLGLAIAKHIVELHGGSITAESRGRGDGSTFTVTLPLDG